MTRVHLDTHILVWLADPSSQRALPARRHLEGRRVLASPMAVLELQYLFEIGRVAWNPDQILGTLGRSVGLLVSESPWTRVVEIGREQGWTRDPFDRLIVAHALADGCLLISADETILRHCPAAVFGDDKP